MMALILFDYDGVLADTLKDLLRFSQEICDELGIQHQVVKQDISTLEAMSFANLGRRIGVPEALVDEFVRRSLEKVANKKEPPRIFPELAAVVKTLSTRHILGVVTTNSSPNVKAFLRQHGLEDCFRAIYGIDQPGSKAQKISQARNQFAAADEAVFMIGDAASDIRAAQEASAQSIGIGWGHQSVEMLIRAQADYIVHSPKELLEIFTLDGRSL
jgi:phosphoglycolate phosphatase